MKIKQLDIYYGGKHKSVSFSNKINLVKSLKNTVGKSTFLRILFWSFGYQVPSTRKFNFGKLQTKLILEKDDIDVEIVRESQYWIVVGDEEFTIPEQNEKILKKVFGVNNNLVLDNILGAIWFDQEKGWTLLNRGVVIGAIRFSLNRLVLGLDNRLESSALLRELEYKKSELKRYKHLQQFSSLESDIKNSSKNISQIKEKLFDDLDDLKIRISDLKYNLNVWIKSKKNNDAFEKFIDASKLQIKSNDEIVLVTKDNLVGFSENTQYIKAQIKVINSQIKDLEIERDRIIEDQNKIPELVSVEDEASRIDLALKNAGISSEKVNIIVDQFEQEINQIKRDLKFLSEINNSQLVEIYERVICFSKELGINDILSGKKESFLYTSNLREFSGAQLRKLVFAFKMAYIKQIEKYLKYKLPIVLDSPSGQELDGDNIEFIVNILKKYFPDNQIIIASIMDYNFDFELSENSLINIVDSLMENSIDEDLIISGFE